MKRYLVLIAAITAVTLILGCGGSTKSASTTPTTSDRRAELQAELRDWNSRVLEAVREGHEDLQRGEAVALRQLVQSQRHDAEEAERAKVALDALKAAE